MTAQRCNFEINRASSVDPRIAAAPPLHVDLADFVCAQSLLLQLLEDVRLTSGRENSLQGDAGSGAMVGMVDVGAVDKPNGRVATHNHFGPKTPHLPYDFATQFQRVDQCAIGFAQKDHFLHADDSGGGALLLLADGGCLCARQRQVGNADVAARQQQVGDFGAALHPTRSRAGCAKFDVVWVGEDEHRPAWDVGGRRFHIGLFTFTERIARRCRLDQAPQALCRQRRAGQWQRHRPSAPCSSHPRCG